MIQTWLPLPDFTESVRALSDEHLGLQRLHVLELMEHFHDVDVSELPAGYETYNVTGHPIERMWAGYELQLCEYGLECCDEWTQRKGKRDWIYDKLARHLDWATSEDANMNKPNWFGNVDFHYAHQAALVRLDENHYRPQFLVSPERPMLWPESDDAA